MTWSLRRRLAGLSLGALVLFVVGASAAGLGVANLIHARSTIVDHIDPASLTARDLLAAYVDEETAVRGFVLAGREDFLEPYVAGRAAEERLATELARLLRDEPELEVLLRGVQADAQRWHEVVAEPSIAAQRSGDPRFSTPAALEAARATFDEVRASYRQLEEAFEARRLQARDDLDRATTAVVGVLVLAAAVSGLAGLAVWQGLRRWVTLPLQRLGTDARQIAAGDLDHEMAVTGPPEVVEVGRAMDAMRTSLAVELAAVRAAEAELGEANRDLERSNVELEQFAYVASHDLQEPLRKVASFCQLLERRYGDELDERGKQYIAFAVDGATRMQRLINDLLGFSRVGRSPERMQPVALDGALAEAKANLSEVIDATGAVVHADTLPEVLGDPSLLVALFQNLLGNSMKFRTPDVVPEVTITASLADDHWELCATDNGIGIEPRFAERVFVIFQRLHAKEAYEGTGIGLALCRKIVESHGGTMWIDTTHEGGARICWTFPVPSKEPSPA